jgi:hypothetical protein
MQRPLVEALVDGLACRNNASFQGLVQMGAAILQSTQYRRLAEQCDLRAGVTLVAEERTFFREQAVLFYKLARMKERRDAAALLAPLK